METLSNKLRELHLGVMVFMANIVVSNIRPQLRACKYKILGARAVIDGKSYVIIPLTTIICASLSLAMKKAPTRINSPRHVKLPGVLIGQFMIDV